MMKIRRYRAEDFDCVARIYNAARPDEFYAEEGTFSITPWADDEYMMSILDSSEIYLYEEGEILGFCGFTGTRINWLFVDPIHRGKGIGQNLLAYVLTKLVGDATLSVWHSNERAKALYIKQGFQLKRQFYVTFQGRRMLVDKMIYPAYSNHTN